MTVTEMIEKRKGLEKNITNFIDDFELETGMAVTDIEILKSYSIGMNGDRSQIFTDINIEVKLP